MNEKKECCQKQENLELHKTDDSDLIFYKCKVCGCRHFELTVQPGIIFSKGQVI